ncbi:MAG: methylmalonyl Co-A mutase-associated GTPase MeaB [Mycobacterium sp.]
MRDIQELIAAARGGSTRAAGRLLSLVESARRDEVLSALGRSTARVVGITGPPGAGKSTTIAALVGAYREQGLRVAVLAVDPSSPYSGGALLGDRIRMAAHINDPDVLIRSVATRGHLGGLAAAVPAAIRLLAELGYDVVLLETVGVGQSEIEIAAVADPTVVILNPGAGDAVQAAKAGLLEVADIVVVNKADREGADQTIRDLRAETHAPILPLIAAQGEGLPQLVETIDAHYRNDTPVRRSARARAQILSLAQTKLRTHPDLDRLAAAVADGSRDPYTAADLLLGAKTPEPAEMTPGWHAARTPDKPAIVMGSSAEVVTYRELEERSTRFARALRSRGLSVGDHIAILMDNSPAFLEVSWAAQRSGLYYTAINRHLRPGEVQYVLDDCGAKALVTSDAIADVVASLDMSRVPVRVSVGAGSAGFERYDDVLAGESAEPLDDECEGREMLYSSGTTGRPKGVRKPLQCTPLGDPASAPVQIARGLFGANPGSDVVYLCPAPLYHSAPLVFSMSWQRLGGTVMVMERFDPRQCLELIERYRVTHAQFVPTMFVRMLRLPEAERMRYDVSSLRSVMHSAAPCPVAIKRQMLEWWGPIIDEYYSGTEDIGSTFISAQEWLAHPGSVGRPVEECHIVGEDGEELPTGHVGVVYFGGGRAFEYHNDPDKTASVANADGWRTLGDMGYLDEDGYLYLTDRLAHMIISGGVNIYPQEAENVLAGHPAVADVAVFGVPDEEMGEAVKAVVQPAESATAGLDLEEELIAYCCSELATYKCPRTVDFVDQLPRDPSGKLYKRLLRDRYWQGHDSRLI